MEYEFNPKYTSIGNKEFDKLDSELELFKQVFLMERNDDRVLKNKSQIFKKLEKEYNLLFETLDPNSEEDVEKVGSKAKELDIQRQIELNDQPFDIFHEKINQLKLIYNSLKEFNKGKIKDFLKNNLSSKNNFEKLIEEYLGKELLNDKNVVFNSEKTLEAMNNIYAKIQSYEVDDEGKVLDSQISDEIIKDKYPDIYYQEIPF